MDLEEAHKQFYDSCRATPGDDADTLGRKLAKAACPLEPTPELAAIADELIALGANIHVKDEHGCTPLLNAADAGNAALVKKLLDKGADPNAGDFRDEHLGPAICHAAYRQAGDVIRLLLAAGVSPDAQEKPGGRSALILAVDYARGDVDGGAADCIKALVEGGATMDLANDRGWTPLLFCVSNEGMHETAKYLVANGADPEGRPDPQTPFQAARRKCPDTAQFILEAVAAKHEKARQAEEDRQKLEHWIDGGCATTSATRPMRRLQLRPKL